MKVGKNLWLGSNVFIDPSHCFLISIGNNCKFTKGVSVLAHDASTKQFLGYTKIGHVKIGNNVFLGFNTIVLPNVTIGDNVIVGSGSVVAKDIPSNEVWAGNPARRICSLSEYLEKHQADKVFDASYQLQNGLDGGKRAQLIHAVEKDIAYIV